MLNAILLKKNKKNNLVKSPLKTLLETNKNKKDLPQTFQGRNKDI
jgi:hypothetical protein